jgi:hypothetical protein
MTYDSTRSRTILFGGGPLAKPLLNDTWEWNGEYWTQIAELVLVPGGITPCASTAFAIPRSSLAVCLVRDRRSPHYRKGRGGLEPWSSRPPAGPGLRARLQPELQRAGEAVPLEPFEVCIRSEPRKGWDRSSAPSVQRIGLKCRNLLGLQQFGPCAHPDHSGPCQAFTRERDLNTHRPEE